jgi:hypothetical protein
VRSQWANGFVSPGLRALSSTFRKETTWCQAAAGRWWLRTALEPAAGLPADLADVLAIWKSATQG